MRQISFGLFLRGIPNSTTPQNTLRLLPIPVGLLVPASAGGTPLLLPLLFFFSPPSWTGTGTRAHARRALQQLALHVKHRPDPTRSVGGDAVRDRVEKLGIDELTRTGLAQVVL